MFTGIVQATGRIVREQPRAGGKRIWVQLDHAPFDANLGDSIAVDGCCLTVVAREEGGYSFDLSDETLAKTRFATLQEGAIVNLEPALRVGDRLGGHWVTGHVDGIGRIAKRKRCGEDLELAIEVPRALQRYCVEKGSIAVNGVSLTINALSPSGIFVRLIPHTIANTNLGLLQEGDAVNLEADLLAKHLERLLQFVEQR